MESNHSLQKTEMWTVLTSHTLVPNHESIRIIRTLILAFLYASNELQLCIEKNKKCMVTVKGTINPGPKLPPLWILPNPPGRGGCALLTLFKSVIWLGVHLGCCLFNFLYHWLRALFEERNHILLNLYPQYPAWVWHIEGAWEYWSNRYMDKYWSEYTDISIWKWFPVIF